MFYLVYLFSVLHFYLLHFDFNFYPSFTKSILPAFAEIQPGFHLIKPVKNGL